MRQQNGARTGGACHVDPTDRSGSPRGTVPSADALRHMRRGLTSRPIMCAVLSIALIISAPKTAFALDPLSTFAVKIGTSLIVKGFNFLFNQATQGPDVHYETTKQIHQEVRAVHESVLANRALAIDIHQRTSVQIDGVLMAMLDMEGRLKKDTATRFENERIVNLLSSVDRVDVTLSILDRTGKGTPERGYAEKGLRTATETLEELEGRLKYVEEIRAAAVLPRIAAIRMAWKAYNALPHMEQHRVDFAIRAGRWLAGQRQRTGSSDRVLQSLADLIDEAERHAMETDEFLATLADPCAPAWYGYLRIDDFERRKDGSVWVKAVSVSQIERKARSPGSKIDPASDEARFANAAMVQPTRLNFRTRSATLPKPIKLRLPDPSRSLRHIHRKAFNCH